MADIGINNIRIDESKWRKMTPQEIIKEEGKGEEIPSEILLWAQQMAAFAKIPDDVTYESVDGDVGIEALDRLGLNESEFQTDNAQESVETEEPDAVKEPEKDSEIEPEDDEFSLPSSETANETSENEEIEEEFSLASNDLTSNNDEMRKRKERKGIL